jgi:hypothetical protein
MCGGARIRAEYPAIAPPTTMQFDSDPPDVKMIRHRFGCFDCDAGAPSRSSPQHGLIPHSSPICVLKSSIILRADRALAYDADGLPLFNHFSISTHTVSGTIVLALLSKYIIARSTALYY